MGIGVVGSDTGIYGYGNVGKVSKTNNATIGNFADSLNKILDHSTSKKCTRDTYIANIDYGRGTVSLKQIHDDLGASAKTNSTAGSGGTIDITV